MRTMRKVMVFTNEQRGRIGVVTEVPKNHTLVAFTGGGVAIIPDRNVMEFPPLAEAAWEVLSPEERMHLYQKFIEKKGK